jgi:hypothetical protein
MRTLLPLFAALGLCPLLAAACGSDGATTDASTSDAASADATTRIDGSSDAGADANTEPTVPTAFPTVVDPTGDSTIAIRGPGVAAATKVLLDGNPLPFLVSGTAVRTKVGVVGVGLHSLEVVTATGTISLGKIEAWAPTQLANSHTFDARDNVTPGANDEFHLWTRLIDAIPAGRNALGKAVPWVRRDGPCVAYLKNTNKYWMIGGWNGFDVDSPFPGWPSVSTNEVWSSSDGANWALELFHQALPDTAPTRFSPRHYFGCTLLNDRLWMIGGDYTNGMYVPNDTPGDPDVWSPGTRYHDDAWSTTDGIHWTKSPALLPWAVAPVNQPRMLHVAGTFKNKLWVFGGQNGFVGEDPADTRFYNDLWSSADGISWTRVQDNDFNENQTTRPTPRGIISDLVEFNGRLWLVGGGRYTVDGYEKFFQEVWSTDAVDNGTGITWKKHATPPWIGRRYATVKVFDGKMWLLAGYTNDSSFNLRESWFTTDGETWTSEAVGALPWNESHADGVAVGPNGFVMAGGNYTLGNYFDTQTWRMDVVHGPRVSTWKERGTGALTLRANGPKAPLKAEGLPAELPSSGATTLDFSNLGGGAALTFDGLSASLDLPARALQPAGRTIAWVGRSPFVPDDENHQLVPHSVKNPRATVLGDSEDGTQDVAFGLTDGALAFTVRKPTGEWALSPFGGGFSENAGKIGAYAITQDPTSGTVEAFAAGKSLGKTTWSYPPNSGWRTIGAGAGGYDHLFGQLGAVIVLDRVASADEIERLHQWAMARWNAE